MITPQDLRTRADAVLELHDDGELEAAVAACDEVLRLAACCDPDDPVVRESRFTARFGRALVLTELGELEAAAEAYAAAAREPADLDDPDQRHEVAMALLHVGICHDALGRHRDAIAAYDALEARFAGADDPVTRAQVVRGRVNRAAARRAAGDADAALHDVAALLASLDPSDALDAEQFALAVRLRAAVLLDLHRPEDAEVALAEVARCTADHPLVRAQVAAAVGERAEVLTGLGRTGEAQALVRATLAQLEDDPDPDVARAVAALRA